MGLHKNEGPPAGGNFDGVSPSRFPDGNTPARGDAMLVVAEELRIALRRRVPILPPIFAK